MAIYFYNDETVRMQFGSGDIFIVPTLTCGEGSINFFNSTSIFGKREQREIGEVEVFDPPKEIDMSEIPIRMTFTKTESIDVVIEELQKIKECMLTGKQPVFTKAEGK